MDEKLKKVFLVSLFLTLVAVLVTRPLVAHAADPLVVHSVEEALVQHELNVDEENRKQFVIANTEMTLAHEFSHLLIDENELPVLGNMEDAADLLGLMVFSDLLEKIETPAGMEAFSAIADESRMEWDTKTDVDKKTYWNLHPFEPQRFYNLACLVYGSNPEQLENIRDYTELPYARAMYCGDEYRRVKQSTNMIISSLAEKKAQKVAGEGGTFKITYEEPYSHNGNLVRNWIKDAGIVERMTAHVLSLTQLPKDVKVSFVNCSYAEGMWLSDKEEVVICYQLLERYLYLADVRDQPKSEGVLSLTDWSMFCMYESIAAHFQDMYCAADLNTPTAKSNIVTAKRSQAQTRRGNIPLSEKPKLEFH